MSKRKSWWFFSQTPLKSRQATLQCSMSVNIWGGPTPGRYTLTIRHQRLNDVAWHRAASRNIRDVPPCVATQCRLMLGQLKSQRQIQLTCLNSSLLVLFPDVSRLWTSWQHNTCSKVDMNINLKLKVQFHGSEPITGASSLVWCRFGSVSNTIYALHLTWMLWIGK